MLRFHRGQLPVPLLYLAVPEKYCRHHAEKQSHLQMQLESPRRQEQDQIMILTYD